MNKLTQIALAAVITFTSSATVFARGIEVGGNVTQTTTADNIINMGMGQGVIAEQTSASIRGDVKVGGDVKQTVAAKNLINMAMGQGAIARQTISSMDSH